MIWIEFTSIIINILFGIFFVFLLDLISILLYKNHSILLENFNYFLATILVGVIFVLYIDKSIFEFNFYHIIFIIFGAFLSQKTSLLNIRNKSYFLRNLVSKIKKFLFKTLLFSINFTFWKTLIKKISKNKR